MKIKVEGFSMKKTLMIAAVTVAAISANAGIELEKGFREPPASAKSQVR